MCLDRAIDPNFDDFTHSIYFGGFWLIFGVAFLLVLFLILTISSLVSAYYLLRQHRISYCKKKLEFRQISVNDMPLRHFPNSEQLCDTQFEEIPLWYVILKKIFKGPFYLILLKKYYLSLLFLYKKKSFYLKLNYKIILFSLVIFLFRLIKYCDKKKNIISCKYFIYFRD